jgi:hypothetical protein
MSNIRDRLQPSTPEMAREAKRLVKNLQRMSPESRSTLLSRLRANLARMGAGRRWELLYPDRGPLRRDLYRRHTDLFAAGANHLERALLEACSYLRGIVAVAQKIPPGDSAGSCGLIGDKRRR